VRQDKQLFVPDSNQTTQRQLLDSRFKLSDKATDPQNLGAYLHLKNARSDHNTLPSGLSYSLENTQHV
jgi:hypothetical protein